eukprot:719050-Prorocentrum_minimum.AAC.1
MRTVSAFAGVCVAHVGRPFCEHGDGHRARAAGRGVRVAGCVRRSAVARQRRGPQLPQHRARYQRAAAVRGARGRGGQAEARRLAHQAHGAQGGEAGVT